MLSTLFSPSYLYNLFAGAPRADDAHAKLAGGEAPGAAKGDGEGKAAAEAEVRARARCLTPSRPRAAPSIAQPTTSSATRLQMCELEVARTNRSAAAPACRVAALRRRLRARVLSACPPHRVRLTAALQYCTPRQQPPPVSSLRRCPRRRSWPVPVRRRRTATTRATASRRRRTTRTATRRRTSTRTCSFPRCRRCPPACRLRTSGWRCFHAGGAAAPRTRW